MAPSGLIIAVLCACLPIDSKRRLEDVDDGPRSRFSPPVDRVPVSVSVALLKVHHARHRGRELFVDGRPRGPLPVDVALKHGPHRFEILVGPGERLVFERTIAPGGGIRTLELSEP